MKYIKIYGLQRSGTNYIKAIIEKNYHCRVLQNIGGWKHGFVDNEFRSKGYVTDLSKEEVRAIEKALVEEKIPLLHVYRNVFAWIADYREYLQSKKQIVPDIKSMMVLYNGHNTHWATRCDFSIDYVDFIGENANDMLFKLCESRLGLVRKNEFIDASIDEMMARGGDHGYEKNIIKNKLFDKESFLREDYMSQFTKDEIEEIDNLIDFVW